MDFWEQIAIGFIGTVAGAAVALLSSWFAGRSQAHSKEAAALNGLLLDLSLKRALSVGTPRIADLQATAADLGRCKESVLDTRGLLRDARLQLRPNSGAFDHLARMAGACNLFLHKANVKPEKYQFYLSDLQSQLDKEADSLGKFKRVTYQRPGDSAYLTAKN
ncbi:hypothetical protein ACFRJ8_20890 [Arthrobacter sp. NPDC056886]|uniref:hypothetical protein n=1 Tax=Arthrobacter sp. NPDC056886 TaxID=3345960 RepID=UPI00366B9154